MNGTNAASNLATPPIRGGQNPSPRILRPMQRHVPSGKSRTKHAGKKYVRLKLKPSWITSHHPNPEVENGPLHLLVLVGTISSQRKLLVI